MKIRNLNLALILTVFFALNIQAQKKDCSKTCTYSEKVTEVTFKKNKVYEFAYATIIPEEATSLNEYFEKATKIAAEYAGKPFISFSVVKSESEKFNVNLVGIFEWDSPQSRLDFLKDKRYKKIVPLRDAAIQGDMHFGWFKVKEDTQIAFNANKVYEIGTANLVENGGKILQEYNKIAEPIKRSYGGDYPEFKAMFQSIDSKGQATFEPQMQFIVEWRSLEDKEKLFSNEDFKTKALPILLKAIDTFEPVFAKINIQQIQN
ncbi:hypothetical protein [Flavivirga eckloniae]|uniref:DUF1330 domain-containing protein n=1 Tax=Flavivirga eckloniae TaxID=1803846 RepID=A0A2K9PQV3_9FLAO|nr:hypothetical protein [Flavivirga eckloniae]AUP79453.1 hypothetical protein C1H87_12345 [Flavivirga eckloniae]